MHTLKHIRTGYKKVQTGNKNEAIGLQTYTTGEIIMGIKDTLLRLKIGNASVNIDLSKCGLEELENLFQMIETLKKKIVSENSKNVEAFRNVESHLKNQNAIMRIVFIFLGNIMASLEMLILHKKIEFNGLTAIKESTEQENIHLGIVQGLFFALVKQLKTIEKVEKNQERKEIFNKIIASSFAVIKRIGTVKKNQQSQTNILS